MKASRLTNIPGAGRRVVAAVALAAGALAGVPAGAQVNVDRVMMIGRNTLYFDDYVLSIQYFNRAIEAKPWLAEPWFFRAVAKLNLDDFAGAEADATQAIERNPFIIDAYEARGVARQNMGRAADAVADYDVVLRHVPDSRGPLFNKAVALTDMGRYASADSAFSRLTATSPSFDGSWTGRSRLRLLQGDTIGARADAERALQANASSVNARLLLADISLTADDDPAAALTHMDEAVKLSPRRDALYINRAYIRYRLDDYYGALADYDYALTLDPANATALTNRAMLRAELHDLNRAEADLNRALELDPANYRALFNRAVIRRELGALNEALADVDALLEAFPDFAAAWYLRYEVRAVRGDRGADTDRRRSFALASEPLPATFAPSAMTGAPAQAADGADGATADNAAPRAMTQDEAKRLFTTLLTVQGVSPEEAYSNPDIKGRVQDRDVTIELEPMFMLAYYIPSTELKPAGEYLRQAGELNERKLLPMVLQVSNRSASMATDESVYASHTASIGRLTAQIEAASTPRAIDYFARAMDYMTIRDYLAAEADFAKAAELMPDFALALFARAGALYMQARLETSAPGMPIAELKAAEIIALLDRVTELQPGMAMAWFNKGVVMAELADYPQALAAFTRAIELRNDFGEAYYNRGYVNLRLGNRDEGTHDLSRAGQLGIVPSYNLLKRLSR